MNIAKLLNLLFGCHHHNLSRVFTIHKRTYKVCCDCGAEFDYSMAAMSISRRPARLSALGITTKINKAAV